MSEQTRMSKYKDLRNNIDDTSYVPREEDDSDDEDDYYSEDDE